MNIKTVPQAIDDMAVSLGASPSAQIPTVSQALENVYAALGGTRTDLDTMVVSEVIDLITPLIPSGGGGGGGEAIVVHISSEGVMDKKWIEIRNSFPNVTYENRQGETGAITAVIIGESVFIVADEYSQFVTDNENGYPTLVY